MSENINDQMQSHPAMVPGGILGSRSTGSMQDDILQHRVTVHSDSSLSGSSTETKMERARQEYKTATRALAEARAHLEKMEEALTDAKQAVLHADVRCNTTRKAYLKASLES